MWIRVRLDIGWRDLLRGQLGTVTTRDRNAAQRRVEAFASQGAGDVLACLSVRSAFDLYLTALNLPHGTEILYSAITIPDMVTVARAHGLVPIPVDVVGADCHVDLDALERAITDRSRVLVVAHLFGARPDISAVCEVAHARGILVVEDCAQAWCGNDWRGSECADATLFSFGTIKTGTALGGAIARIRDPGILTRMRDTQAAWPVQSQRRYARNLAKLSFLKFISKRIAFGSLVRLAAICGKTIEQLLGGLTRGFAAGDLMPQIRRQPCAALLNLLRHRIETYDTRRLSRRIANARRIIDRLQLAESHPELLEDKHTFWLFPYQADNPQTVIEALRRNGFDATQRGRLEVVQAAVGRPGHACPSAQQILDRTIFLPCYPEMPLDAVDRMCSVIAAATKASPAVAIAD